MWNEINWDYLNKSAYDKALYEYLSPYVSLNKQQKFDEILGKRTRHLVMVLEDIFKPHNASTAIRTAECMGIQDIHVIEQVNKFNLNPYVLRGSGKWLTIYHHRMKEKIYNAEVCFNQLRQQGYKIVATTPHHGAVDFYDLNIDQKTAVVFGAEETGISDYVRANADQLIKIPMMGFTESFNISVSAAIVLEHFNRQIRQTQDWQLPKEEWQILKMEWMQKSVRKLDVHIREFEKQIGKLNQ